MRKIREVLRLKYEQGLSNRDIANACRSGKSTIGEYLQRAKAAGLSWSIAKELDDEVLEKMLFPAPVKDHKSRPRPDWDWVHKELKRKGVTLQLLWQEYLASHPEGYQYGWFTKHYRHWAAGVDVVMRQEYKAGEKLFVDYAGLTLGITDPSTGEVRQAEVFVAVLGASNYSYVEVTESQSLEDWLGSHQRALEFFGGVPAVIVPDNLKAGVSKPCYYEPELNPSYAELARHYGLAVIPARVRKPRDKAKVEVGVQIVERQVLAPLRHRTFFSTYDANLALWKQLEWLNEKPFQKLPGSRKSFFDEIEKPALKPLPATPYQFARWKRARINVDYHFEIKGLYYSVPFRFIHQTVDVRISERTIEAFHKGKRIASHVRPLAPEKAKGRYITISEHMPKAHQRHGNWSPSKLKNWASKVGENTALVVEHILTRWPHPEQGYRSCLGLKRLAKAYGNARLEAASRRAVFLRAYSYQSINSILKRGLDQNPLPQQSQPKEAPTKKLHENIRGPHYYQQNDLQEAERKN